MNLNFAGLSKVSTSTLLPAGVVAFEVQAVNPEYVSPGTGSQAIEIKCRVVNGPDFEDGTSCVGMVRTVRLWYPKPTQKDGGKACLTRIKQWAEACGLVIGDDDGFDPEAAVGVTFVAKVKHQMGQNGEPQEDYSGFKAYQG